jgi:hypothetical protein
MHLDLDAPQATQIGCLQERAQAMPGRRQRHCEKAVTEDVLIPHGQPASVNEFDQRITS